MNDRRTSTHTPTPFGRDLCVYPDDHEFVKGLLPGCIGADMRRFYIRESDWPRIRAALGASATGEGQ